MLNQIVLVGRLTNEVNLKKTENDKNVANITLAIPRSFKNINGTYDTDFIDCVLWDSVATNTAEYCNKGDIVGIKGRMQSRVLETEKEKKYITEIIAEKVTFLYSKNQEKNKNSKGKEER